MLTFTEYLEEASRPRIRLIRVRVRGGGKVIQRRKRVSNVKGYTLRGNTLKRISALERLHRRRGARLAKIKRRAKRAIIARKRMRSMRRRKSMGL